MRIKERRVDNRSQAEKALMEAGVDRGALKKLSEKLRFRVIEIKNVKPAVANIIKQIAISRGTDAAVHREVIVNKVNKSTVILPGTDRELKLIAGELKKQPFGLPAAAERIMEIVREDDRAGDFRIMGILNITPDSFSDGGDYFNEDNARRRFEQIVLEGADIIDIGAESSRPGSSRVSEEEELRRLQAVLPLFDKHDITISIDTYKSAVARQALENGASIVNDISALRMDEKMVNVVKDYDADIVLMHMKGKPETMQKEPHYEDVIDEIYEFFEERMDFCMKNGIEKENIILDPGIGFGKRHEDNLMILNRIREFTEFGVPILVGTSRKSFLGEITGKEVDQRMSGSLASVVHSYLQGVSIFRVHDVDETLDALSVIRDIEDIE